MLLKMSNWADIESMPCFEREWFYDEAVEIYTDKKTGQIKLPG